MPDQPTTGQPTLLCVSRHISGRRFVEAALAAGAHVWVLTAEEHRNAPCEAPLAGIGYVRDLDDFGAVATEARRLLGDTRVNRIVCFAERDVLTAARLREALEVPGPREADARLFRDKLLMRERAAVHGIAQPAFVSASSPGELARYVTGHVGPYVLKVRDGVGASEVRRFNASAALLEAVDALGERRSNFMVERFVPGAVYHVDSLVWEGRPVFHNAARYGVTMLDLITRGGHFVSYHIERGTPEERAIAGINAQVIAALGLGHGVTHAEFIRDAEGQFHFLEIACRVGAARTPQAIEAARGVSLYAEWAKMEVTGCYEAPHAENHYAGVILSVAKGAPANLAGYTHGSIVWRSPDPYLPGLIVRHEEPAAVEGLLREAYGSFDAYH